MSKLTLSLRQVKGFYVNVSHAEGDDVTVAACVDRQVVRLRWGMLQCVGQRLEWSESYDLRTATSDRERAALKTASEFFPLMLLIFIMLGRHLFTSPFGSSNDRRRNASFFHLEVSVDVVED